MAYEKEKDKQIWEEVKELGDTKIAVGIYHYEGLDPRVQISRQNKFGEEWKWVKLGRLTKDELDVILPLLQEAKEKL